MSEPTKPAAPAAPGGDPSMEDILASIRRILSEDEPPPDAASHGDAVPPAGEPGHGPGDDKDVLVLDPSMMIDEPPRNAPLEHRMSADTSAEPAHAFEPAPSPPAHATELVAPEAAAAAASSVGSLVRALTERSAQVHHGGPTIEDLVRDEIRPILKQWLDTHLPPIVERLVRLEIERVVGRAVP